MTTSTDKFDGRVFMRMQQFDSLAPELQTEIISYEKYLIDHKAEVFENHHPGLVSSVYSVRGKDLLETTLAFLKINNSKMESNVGGLVHPLHSASDANKNQETIATGGLDSVQYTKAKHLIEGLILHGFITPRKEKDHDSPLDNDEFDESELYVPLVKEIVGYSTSVWSVVDGAIYAGYMKRKAGLLEKLAHGKEVYVVINQNLKTMYLFDSETSQEPLVAFEGPTGAFWTYDGSHFDYGVKVTNDIHQVHSELLDAGSEEGQYELVAALARIGVLHVEAQKVGPHATEEATPIGLPIGSNATLQGTEAHQVV
jgi:hypothetical protein